MRKVVLAYHAVGGTRCPAVVGSFPVSMARFAAQVAGIRDKGWTFRPLSQLHAPADGDACYITGDDGTVDWARNVLPWCESNAVPTHTAIISGVWADRPVYPIAHRVQVLLAVKNSEQLPRPTLTAEQTAYIDKIYAYETDPARRHLKGACNIFFDYRQADEFLGTMDYDCARLLAQRFARPEEYKPFKLAELGAHTVLHGAYDGNAERYFAEEVFPCLQTLLAHGLNAGRFFTLPVKPKGHVSLEPLCDLLRRHGFAGMLHNPGEWNQRDFIVTRVDAKDVDKFFGIPESRE